MLKYNLFLIAVFCFFIFLSCDSDEIDLKTAFENTEYSVYINSPENGQGFSIKETIEFRAVAQFYGPPGSDAPNASLFSFLGIEFYSDKDGLLDGELINQNGNILFRSRTLSSGEHNITLRTVDPNQIEKSSSININTLAPGTIKLSVIKDSRENAMLKWSLPSPELIDIFELYRTQYTYDDGGNYSSEPWDTIRFKPDINQSFYDSQLPFADKVIYSIKAFTKDEYWSKNEFDTTISGTKRFDFQLNSEYGSDAISIESEKIIHIRNGNNVTAYDFENMSVNRNLELDFPINYFHIGDYGHGAELYISNGQILQIYNSRNYEMKTEIGLGYEIEGIQGHNNILFLSMVNHFNRISLFQTNHITKRYRFRLLEDGFSQIAISYSGTPTNMKYINFKNNINNPEVIDDKYHGTYPLNSALFEVIPKQNHVITSWFGSIYSADENMEFIGSLFDAKSEFFNCFAFNNSGTIIYAGLEDHRKISIYNFPEMKKLDEVNTKGYPVFLFFKDNNLISVSSTKEFDWPKGPSEIGFEIFDL